MIAILMSFVMFSDGGPIVISPSQDDILPLAECQKFVDSFSKLTPAERIASTEQEDGRAPIDKQYRCITIPMWDIFLTDMVRD